MPRTREGIKVMPKKTTGSRANVTTRRAVSSSPVPKRKAPVFKQTQNSSFALNKPIMALMGFFVVVAGTSVFVGVSDSGVINVASVVQERNVRAVENASSGEEVTTVNVPKNDSTLKVPNGGLRAQGGNNNPPPPALPAPELEPASTTATTKEDIGLEDNQEQNESTLENAESEINSTST